MLKSRRTAGLTLWFIVFLYPVIISELAVNYSFTLLPLLHLLRTGSFQRPPRLMTLAMGVYASLFVIACVYQWDFVRYLDRRFLSFAIFMTIFAYVFIKIDAAMAEAFKMAIVVASTAFSVQSIIGLVLAGSDIGFGAKDVVGSQRYGFIYLMAIWSVYFQAPRHAGWRTVKYIVLTVLLAGLLLTFSRSSIVGLLVSSGVFAISRYWGWIKRPGWRGIRTFILSIAGVAALAFVLRTFVPVTFEFFGDRLFNTLSNAEMVRAQMLDPTASAGVRLVIWQNIVEFVLRNPITGSGYLGVWILPEARSGSAHNQYADVLFRTGMVGVFVYLYLLFRLLRYLRRHDQSLFWGLGSVLVYGMFHETFKESQGAFVLAFLLGLLAQSIRDAIARRSSDARSRMSLNGC